ncbi:DUF3857 and transglutaminase domain-containing protein [Flavobacterium pallidum]|uniref:Transglutaminase n=1 Tax=Flavobacterium pallidum TaxID=2172098 RepID=A0A2S1SGM0_9FLAO|nr:DUF3857 and transglutaminase domain-containing protein [Flavobacterium pallidum]AWI25519.1 transglutaminase [Flavobacterium pallidum]
MNQNVKILLLLLFAISPVTSQKFEIGKVSIEELQQKSHPADSSAEAAILFKTGITTFDFTPEQGFLMTTKVKTRIKIYKKDGYDWGNFEQEYYKENNNSREKVSFSDAVTYNLENGKIVKSKLKSEGEFDEQVNKFWGRKKITMPNVREGSVIEYVYTITSPNITKLDDWDFQTSIPVNYSEYKTEFPEYFVYKINQRGFIFPKVTTETLQRSFLIQGKDSSSRGIGGGSAFTQDKVDYQLSRTTYVAQNLGAMKDEDFVNNIHNYTAGVSHELSIIKYPQSPVKYLSTDWVSVAKAIYDNDNFGAELNKSGYFEEDLKSLTAAAATVEEKVAAIYNYVKQNVKWNGYYGYSCNDGVKQAYKNKTGNVAEINLMLTAMLREAGFNANPVLVSTRSHGISFFPSRAAFNYVIAAIEYNGKITLLDATEKYALPGILPTRDLNWLGRLIRKDGTSMEIDLMPSILSKETVNIMVGMDAAGSISGKVRSTFTDYNALYFRQMYGGMKSEEYLEKLENNNNKIEISDYKRENEDDFSKPLSETYSIHDANDTEIIGDKIYITPLLFMNTKVNPFKQEVREYPVDFTFPFEKKYSVTIDVPQGYTVESLPQNASFATESKFGAFKYMIVNSGNKIQAVITLDILASIVSNEDYPVLKDFFQRVIDKQNEKIVFKKI